MVSARACGYVCSWLLALSAPDLSTLPLPQVQPHVRAGLMEQLGTDVAFLQSIGSRDYSLALIVVQVTGWLDLRSDIQESFKEAMHLVRAVGDYQEGR